MRIVEEEGDVPNFVIDVLSNFFFLPTAEMTAHPMGKIIDFRPAT